MAGYLFFRTSRSAYRQITELFDFVTPAAAALWNLRWQVAGFCSHHQAATVQMLDDRFLSGSGLRGANFKRACIETSWADQQQQFAKFLLISLFSIYEGWLADVLQIVAPAARRKNLAQWCQFPNSTARSGNGIAKAAAEIKLKSSPMLVGAFYAALRAQKKNALPQLEALLMCYRAFKESRNSFAHQSGFATQGAVDAYGAYAGLSISDLDVSEKPALSPVSLNSPIVFDLRGAIGFSGIILRIIATLDAEFSCAQAAEHEFRAQWVEFFSVNGKVRRIMLKSAGVNRREKQLERLVSRLRLPRPSQTSQIEGFLKQHGFVT
jgi:hypothetical protein